MSEEKNLEFDGDKIIDWDLVESGKSQRKIAKIKCLECMKEKDDCICLYRWQVTPIIWPKRD